MRVFGDDRVAVRVVGLQFQRVELVLAGQRRAGIFLAPITCS